MGECHALDIDYREASEAPGFEGHPLLERGPSLHAERLDDPVDEVGVRLGDGPLLDACLDVLVLDEDEVAPVPVDLGRWEVELTLDSVREVVREAVRVAKGVACPMRMSTSSLFCLVRRDYLSRSQRRGWRATSCMLFMHRLSLCSSHGVGEEGRVDLDILWCQDVEGQEAQPLLGVAQGVGRSAGCSLRAQSA